MGFGTWIRDLNLGLEFGTWIWNLDLGLGFGTGIGLDNYFGKNIDGPRDLDMTRYSGHNQ